MVCASSQPYHPPKLARRALSWQAHPGHADWLSFLSPGGNSFVLLCSESAQGTYLESLGEGEVNLYLHQGQA